MLNRNEQIVVRAAGGFLDLLVGEHRERVGGCTARDVLGHEDGWIDYDGKGVRFSYWTESDPRQLVLTVTWKAIRRHGAELPIALLDRIREHHRAIREHQAKAPTYPNKRLSPDGWAEAHRYWNEVHMPEWRALVGPGRALLDEAYPLTVDPEPADFLELLGLS